MPEPEPPTVTPTNADANRAEPQAANAANANDTTDTAQLGAIPPQNGRGSVSSFLFMTVMLFMLTNGGGDDLLVRSQYRDSLRSLRMQEGNFSAWLWGGGNAVVNATEGLNFTLPETDQSSISLAHSVMGFGLPLHPAFASYYSNITGFIHGPARMHNLTAYLSQIGDYDGLRSSPPLDTGPEPKSEFSVSLSPPHPPSWAPIAGTFLKGLNITRASERIGSWNWSAPVEMAFRVLEKRPIVEAWGIDSKDKRGTLNDALWADISLMHGRVELTDKETGDELGFDLEAVHFQENGTVYGFVEPSGRHVDVRDLPSLVPAQYMNATAQAVDAELLARIRRLQDMVDSGVMEFDSQDSESPKTTCPFTLFGQLVPTSVPLHLMQELESELDNPTGITTVGRPDLKMNAVLMSKECGILLEVREAKGLKSPRFWRKVTTYSGVAALVYLALLLLFVRQTAASQTPAGISCVSRWTFLTQAAADSISFVGHVTFGILADGRPSLSLIAPAFLASVLLVYEAQFSVLIHQIQQPEENSPAPPRPTPAPSPTAPPTDSPSGQNSLSGAPPMAPTLSPAPDAPTAGTSPLRAAQPSTPGVITQIWRRLRESPQARLWVCMIFALTLFVRVLVSPALALLTLAGVYGSFWIPQIVRSARRGVGSGLRAEYLVGTTACRAFFALYLFACPENVLGVDTSPWIFVLAAFVSLQVAVVLLQDYLGPGFFLPRSYTPAPTHDYHPYIPPPDAEAPEAALGDCAICMDAIVLPLPSHTRTSSSLSDGPGVRRRSSVSEKLLSGAGSEKVEERRGGGVGGARGILDRIGGVAAAGAGVGTRARKNYALAPCHHLFHTTCLERWLAIKNICPQCRRPLPPL